MNTLTAAALSTAAMAAAIAAAVPAVALAQDAPASPIYGSLGYAYSQGVSGDPASASTIQGRLGARLNRYFGAEGELAIGIGHDNKTVNGTPERFQLQRQAAAYGVGYLPLQPNFDLLARIGYGATRYRTEAPGVSFHRDLDSWNYGVGAQYSFTPGNGVRADYTREEFRDPHTGSANLWSVAYVHRF
jgi:outer membrane immunogenic protein